MKCIRYIHIKLSEIPREFIEEYNLAAKTHNGWVYFELLRRTHGLPQSVRLAKDLLRKYLEKAGYYEAATVAGLW